MSASRSKYLQEKEQEQESSSTKPLKDSATSDQKDGSVILLFVIHVYLVYSLMYEVKYEMGIKTLYSSCQLYRFNTTC